MRIIATIATATLISFFHPAFAEAESYVIDSEGAHASIHFKVSHLGFSWLTGSFRKFDGQFVFDPDMPTSSEVTVEIDTASLDSNHELRDKHLRSDDFLHTSKYPKASFKSTRIEISGDNAGTIYGNLTLHGITKEVAIQAHLVGKGDDPWGGHRVGFSGKTTIKMSDFGMERYTGSAADNVELSLNIEGIRK